MMFTHQETSNSVQLIVYNLYIFMEYKSISNLVFLKFSIISSISLITVKERLNNFVLLLSSCPHPKIILIQ